MSTEDVLRHIISDVVHKSTQILKSHRIAHQKALERSATDSISLPVSQPMDTAVPEQQPTGEDVSLSAREFHTLPPSQPFTNMADLFTIGASPILQAHQITETLAAFVVRAVVMNPKYAFHLEKEFTREEVERLIQKSVEAITTVNDSCVMDTIRMQVFFDTSFPAQADHLHREKLDQSKKSNSLMHEIVDSKAKLASQFETLYRKIVMFVLIKSHIGSETDIRAVKEATAALESVFPQSELNAFVALSREEKEAQLVGLAQLVTGIRLFNKQLKKGGESIVDVVSLCQTESDQIYSSINETSFEAKELIEQYSAIVAYSNAHTDSLLQGDIPIPKVKSLIIFFRQFLIYLDALSEQTNTSHKLLETVKENFDQHITDLKSTCRSKTVVPVDQVYPQFISCANLWSNWYDELFLLAYRHGILEKLTKLMSYVKVNVSEDVGKLIAPFKKGVMPELEADDIIIRNSTELGIALSVINRQIEVLHPLNFPQFHSAILEFSGFCPVALTTQEYLILPGSVSLGIIRYRDKLFAFHSIAAAKEFARRPDEIMHTVIDHAKASPDLIQLLQLYAYFPTVEALERAKSYNRQKFLGRTALISDMGCQTDTHILDEFVDKNYHWNEWEHRKKALMYVNLKGKITHSTQTNISHFRRDNETQNNPQRLKETQTMLTKGNNVAKSVSYLANLRNDGSHQFKRIDLTLSLDGTPAPNRPGPFKTTKPR